MKALPAGWRSVRVDQLVTLNPKTEASPECPAGFIPMASLGTRYLSEPVYEVRRWGEISRSYVHFRDNDVLLAKITPCFENGKAGIPRSLPSGIGAGSSEFFVCRPIGGAIEPGFLLAHFKTQKFLHEGALKMTGSVGHKRVTKEYLSASEIPLPPLLEQQRIITKLNALLGRVDGCRERLDRVGPLIRQFRQAVLAAAASGRLTEDWRTGTQAGDAAAELDDWLSFRAAAESKPPAEPDLTYWTTDVPVGWVVASTSQFAQCLDRLRIPIKREKRKNAKGLYPYYGANGEVGRIDEYIFDDELVLVTEDETFYGREKPIAYRSSGKCWVNNHAHVLRARTKAASDYLCFALMHYDVTPWLTGTSGRAKLTQQALNSLPIAIPPNAELIEIVQRVETLFAFADRLESRLAKAQTAVGSLTPSLLARAFRGELVPPAPDDERANVPVSRPSTVLPSEPGNAQLRDGAGKTKRQTARTEA